MKTDYNQDRNIDRSSKALENSTHDEPADRTEDRDYIE